MSTSLSLRAQGQRIEKVKSADRVRFLGVPISMGTQGPELPSVVHLKGELAAEDVKLARWDSFLPVWSSRKDVRVTAP